MSKRRNRALSALASLLVLYSVLTLAPCEALAADVAFAVEEPRPYGHVVGDLLTREVRLTLPAGMQLDERALPRPGRVGSWLELQAIRLTRSGATATLRLDYQIVNVGPEVVTTVLPALRLPLVGGNPGAAVDVPDWPLHLSTLTPGFAVERAGLQVLQPDIAPERAALAPLLARLTLYAVFALLLAAPAWIARHPHHAFWRRHAPFNAAWRDLRHLRSRARAAPGEAVHEAFRRLHAAFDRAAGRTVFAAELAPLYEARPVLRAAAGDIEAFFAASRQAFFAGGAPPAWSLDDALVLALALARLEGRGR